MFAADHSVATNPHDFPRNSLSPSPCEYGMVSSHDTTGPGSSDTSAIDTQVTVTSTSEVDSTHTTDDFHRIDKELEAGEVVTTHIDTVTGDFATDAHMESATRTITDGVIHTAFGGSSSSSGPTTNGQGASDLTFHDWRRSTITTEAGQSGSYDNDSEEDASSADFSVTSADEYYSDYEGTSHWEDDGMMIDTFFEKHNDGSSARVFAESKSFSQLGRSASWSTSFNSEHSWNLLAEVTEFGYTIVVDDSGTDSDSESSGSQTYEPGDDDNPSNNYDVRHSPFSDDGQSGGDNGSALTATEQYLSQQKVEGKTLLVSQFIIFTISYTPAGMLLGEDQIVAIEQATTNPLIRGAFSTEEAGHIYLKLMAQGRVNDANRFAQAWGLGTIGSSTFVRQAEAQGHLSRGPLMTLEPKMRAEQAKALKELNLDVPSNVVNGDPNKVKFFCDQLLELAIELDSYGAKLGMDSAPFVDFVLEMILELGIDLLSGGVGLFDNLAAGLMKGKGCFVAGTPVCVSALPMDSSLLLHVGQSSCRAKTNPFDGSLTFPNEQCLAIESIPLGARVASKNPRPWDYDNEFGELSPPSWKEVEFEVENADGSRVTMQVLRPNHWLTELQIYEGAEIAIQIAELRTLGKARVVNIKACPQIAEGEGSLVTGRFVTHGASGLVEIEFENGECLTGTAIHRIWSETKSNWTELGSLTPGELVLSRAGELAVAKVTAIPGKQPVYNLEIDGEHVYEVTEFGILVHNIDCWNQFGKVFVQLTDELGNPIVPGPNPNGLQMRVVSSPTPGEGGAYLKPEGGKTKIGSTGDFKGRYGPNGGIVIEIPQTRNGPPAGVDDSMYRWTERRQRRFDEEYMDRVTPPEMRYRDPTDPKDPVRQRKWEKYRHIFGYGDLPPDFGS